MDCLTNRPVWSCVHATFGDRPCCFLVNLHPVQFIFPPLLLDILRISVSMSVRPSVGWSRIIFGQRKSLFLRVKSHQMTSWTLNNDTMNDDEVAASYVMNHAVLVKRDYVSVRPFHFHTTNNVISYVPTTYNLTWTHRKPRTVWKYDRNIKKINNEDNDINTINV